MIFIVKDPMNYIRILENDYHLQRVGVFEYYLEEDTELVKNGKMSWSAKICIKNITERI